MGVSTRRKKRKKKRMKNKRLDRKTRAASSYIKLLDERSKSTPLARRCLQGGKNAVNKTNAIFCFFLIYSMRDRSMQFSLPHRLVQERNT